MPEQDSKKKYGIYIDGVLVKEMTQKEAKECADDMSVWADEVNAEAAKEFEERSS